MRPVHDRPNIIIICADDLGYGDLGCYSGNKHSSTPAIDRLASEGVRFTDFYSPSPVCTGGAAAIMTGCYPRRIGLANGITGWSLFPGDPIGINPAETTLASCLQSRGYATQLIGKWHLGDQPDFLPTRNGFNHWYGIPYSNDMGISKGREHYPPLPLMRDEEVIQQQPDQAALCERYIEESIRFIRNHHNSPFYLHLAHVHPHLPLLTPRNLPGMQNETPAPYQAALTALDWSVAMLSRTLSELELDRNTLIIFTSDHGSTGKYGAGNAPLRGTKGTVLEGGVRVPVIFRWHGIINSGTTCRACATTMDILPTCTKLAGGAIPTGHIIDGHDIRPLMMGELGAESPYDAIFFYRRNDLAAMRSGKWKLHLDSGGLFDLENDPSESSNVASTHMELIRELEGRAERCRSDIGDTATGTEGANCRACGRVNRPEPLTRLDPTYPYFVPVYPTPFEQ